MRKKTSIRFVTAMVVLSFVFCPAVLAQGIKERFKQRLPQIIQLKSEGVVGENNQGYLQFVGEKKKMADMVDAENEDRRLVYEKIAESENTTTEKVGRRRAIQLRDLAKPGDWLQDESGNWYRK